MNKKYLTVVVAVVVVAIVLFVGIKKSGAGTRDLVATGSLEGTETDINSKIPGKVVKVYVNEGDKVKAGQIIAKISDDELQAKKAQAVALVSAAKSQLDQAKLAATLQDKVNRTNVEKAMGAYEASEAQLKKAKNGARAQEIAQAQANYDLWVKTSQRVHKLLSKGAVPTQKVDEVDTQLKVAEQTLKMAKEGAREEDIEAAAGMADAARASVEQANAGLLQTDVAKLNVTAAQAKYDQAVAGLKEVEAYLKDTVIKAPVDGEISVVYTDPGELVSSGMPIATITSDKFWVEVKVKETDVDKISVHQLVDVTLASGKTVPGEVVWKKIKPDFAAKRATGERDDQDVLAYGIKIKLNSKCEGAAIGETVKVKFGR